MEPSQYHAAKEQLCWAVVACRTDERYPPRAPWWWDNSNRGGGFVVFQAIRAGRCIYRDKQGDREVAPGQAFFFAYEEPTAYGRPQDRPDWAGWNDQLRMDYIALSGAGVVEHWRLLRARFGNVVDISLRPRCLTLIADIERQLRTLDDQDRSPSSTLAHAFVMSLFDELEATAAEGMAPVDRAIDELLRAPLSVASLKDVARRHDCAREHVCRVFSERMKMSPGRWLRKARLQRVVQLLKATDLPLATIATQSGFASVRTMTRLVSRLTGRSPGALRKNR